MLVSLPISIPPLLSKEQNAIYVKGLASQKYVPRRPTFLQPQEINHDWSRPSRVMLCPFASGCCRDGFTTTSDGTSDETFRVVQGLLRKIFLSDEKKRDA